MIVHLQLYIINDSFIKIGSKIIKHFLKVSSVGNNPFISISKLIFIAICLPFGGMTPTHYTSFVSLNIISAQYSVSSMGKWIPV
jgi:hypothetical protein